MASPTGAKRVGEFLGRHLVVEDADLLHRLVRPSYDRMLTAEFGTSRVTPTITNASAPAERVPRG